MHPALKRMLADSAFVNSRPTVQTIYVATGRVKLPTMAAEDRVAMIHIFSAH